MAWPSSYYKFFSILSKIWIHLPITSIVEVYKRGKVRTVMMLQESRDTAIHDNPPEVKTGKK